MAHPSTSTSLANPQFDAWLARRMQLLATHVASGSTQAAHVGGATGLLRFFQMDLMPYLTYKDSEPVWVRMNIFGQEGVRGILKIQGGPIWAPRIYFISGEFRKEPKEVPSGAKVIRYRVWKSKRWRAPKEFHKDQTAFYMLRYR